MGERNTYLPFAKLTAATFWVAWVTVVFSGDIVVSPSVSSYDTTTFILIYSTLGMGVSMVAGGCFPKVTWKIIMSTKTILACGFTCMAATYLMGFEAFLPRAVFFLVAIAAGVSLGFILIRCSIVFEETNPKTAAIFAGSCGLAGVLIYGLFSLISQYHPPLVVLFMSGLLPLLSAFSCLLEGDGEDVAFMLQDTASETLTPAFWRVVAFMIVIFFTLSVIRGFYPQLIDPIQFDASRADAALMLAMFFLIFLAVVITRSYDYAFGKMFYGMFMLAVGIMVPAVMLGSFSTFSGSLATLSKGILFLSAWNFLSLWSYKTGMSPVKVFGFGFGATLIASFFGYATGNFAGEIISQGYGTIFESIVLFACAVLAVLLLRIRDLQVILTPSSAMVESVEDTSLESTDAHVSRETASEEETRPSHVHNQVLKPTEEEPADNSSYGEDASMPDWKQGRFKLRCNLIADTYGLTPREADVFFLLAKHREVKAIADELYVSFNTARTHVRHIYAKLDVHNRRELDEFIDAFSPVEE